MLGRFRFNDEPLTGDDGTFNSPFVVVTAGILFPLILVGLAVWVAWAGGFTIRGEVGLPVHYEGFFAIAGAMGICLGVALILVAKYLLPNVYRDSYRYQYFAITGAALAGLGLIGLVVMGILK